MKRYVTEFENDFEKAFALKAEKNKKIGKQISEDLLFRAINIRNDYLCGLLTERDAMREIMKTWDSLDEI